MTITAVPSFKILNFYKNQSQIIADFCVNKEKPQLNCQGHCYLKKQLTEKESNQPVKESLPEIEIFNPVFAPFSSEIVLTNALYKSNKAFYPPIKGEIMTYNSDVFNPPKVII